MFLFDLGALELAVLLLTFCVAGTVKGALGLGVPIVSVPVVATILGLPTAVSMMIVPLLTTNLWQIWQYRHTWRQVGIMVPMLSFAVIGIALGTTILVRVDERILFGVLGCIVLIYIGINTLRPSFAVPERIGFRVAPFVGLGAGMLQGTTGISAPISLVFLHALRWPREVFIFAVSVMFLTFGCVQIVTLSVAGIFDTDMFIASALIVPPLMAFMPIGAALGRRFSKTVFERLVLALLGLMALRLLYVAFVAG